MRDIDGYIFWKRIDELRTKSNINTLKELSLLADINYRRIYDQRFNLSIPKAIDLLKLSDCLNTSIEYLLTGTQSKVHTYSPEISKIAEKLTKVSKLNLLSIENIVANLPEEITEDSKKQIS